MKEQIVFEKRSDFRNWLEENTERKDGIWLTFGKSSSLKTLKYEEALEDALCFGWIDGQFDSIDETKYLKYFSPRRKGSKWSEKNKNLVAKLAENKLMTPWGLKAVEAAKQDGTWDIPQGSGVTEEQIDEFTGIIRFNGKASEHFAKMSMSVKKQFMGFYYDAKKEETRKRRLEKIIGLLELNKRLM